MSVKLCMAEETNHERIARLEAERERVEAERKLKRDAWYEDHATEPPEHLSERSKELWRNACPQAIRSEKRLVVLRAALEALDRADAARLAIAEQGMISITERSGMAHVNPLVKVEREARLDFAKLWKQTGLETWETPVPRELEG
jgi:phage terminase small subunit